MAQPARRPWTRRRIVLLAAVLLLAAAGTAAALWAIGVFRHGSTSGASACRSAPASTTPQPSGIFAPSPTAPPAPQPPPVAAAKHYEYVFPGGGVDVYDADAGWKLVKHVDLPTTDGVRGVAVGAPESMLYVSHGGDGGFYHDGSLLKYDLARDQIVWNVGYNHGIDSFSITPDGNRIYMPDGEISGDSTWCVVDTANGAEIGRIDGGNGPHNTVVSASGQHVYFGGRFDDHLIVADTSTGKVTGRIGPLRQDLRPFAISADERYAFTTASDYIGFQVSDISARRVLYSVSVPGFRRDPPPALDAPSHGISLSPDEREVYVVDQPNSYVHVFDVTGLPAAAPRKVADIALRSPLGEGMEKGCAYDCEKFSWLQHSLRPPQVGMSILLRFMPRRAGRSVGGGPRGCSLVWR
jgi:DNA-binding beta-propeller fold protein YncE